MTKQSSRISSFAGIFLICGCLLMFGTYVWFTMDKGKEHTHVKVEEETVNADIVALMQKIQEDPENAEALRDLGLLFISTQDWARAEYFLKQSTAFDPYNASTLSYLGLAQYRLQNYPAAALTLEMSLTHGKTAEALFNLGTIQVYKLGAPEKGKALFEELLTLEKGSEQLKSLAQKELEKLAQATKNENE